jgi:hypothetical protein
MLHVLTAALVLLIFLSDIHAEQSITAAQSKFGLRLINPLSVGLKLTNPVANRHNADQVGREDDDSRNRDMNISIKSLKDALRKGVVEVRKDLVGCYKSVAGAKDNYDRMERVLDVLTSHKRSVAVEILCMCGLFSLYGPGPEE